MSYAWERRKMPAKVWPENGMEETPRKIETQAEEY
jgi:hypothetical protein